jgi:protein arginine N-methyltransferase 1
MSFRTVWYLATNRQLEMHAFLLNDAVRTLSYREAIRRVVRLGDVVADLGTGSGILAFFAAQAGASQVFAVEYAPVIHLAERAASINGMADRITFINGNALAVELPRPADVLVSEAMEVLGTHQTVRAVIQARPRWLKPGGRVIPERLRICLAPVQAPKAYSFAALEAAQDYGMSLAPLKDTLLNMVYSVALQPDQMLAAPQVVYELDLATATSATVDAEASFRITRAGTLHGLGGWFEAGLAPGIVLRTAPDAPETSWHQAFLPLLEPQCVEPGESVRVRLQIHVLPNETFYQWDVCLRERVFEQCTVNSFPALPIPPARYWEENSKPERR